MTDILLHGCNGRMGQMIAGLLENDADARIVAGVDAYTGRENPFPVFSKIEDCDVKADVVIDFPTPEQWTRCLPGVWRTGLLWCSARQAFRKSS